MKCDEHVGKQDDPLDDEQVAQYLLNHPDFFIRQSRLVEQMRIPHPVRGTVSLVEWQLARQRQQIERLEEEITLLMELARSNESLFRELLELQSRLAMAGDLQTLLDELTSWAKAQGLMGAHLRLFSEKWQLTTPSSFLHLGIAQPLFEPIRIQRFGEQAHYLGPLNGSETSQLLPEYRHVGSVAMMLIGEKEPCGVLIFSSRDSQHYQPGMDTLLLRSLGRFLDASLSRWIPRR